MIELNIHKFLFIFQIGIKNIHNNFIVIKIIDIIFVIILISWH
jgi:hypothetical protein